VVGSDSARLGGMDSKQCGRSGLYLSSIGLGTLTWGRDTDAPEALEMLTHFVDAGGSLLECSPAHGDGMAVDVVSEAVAVNAVGAGLGDEAFEVVADLAEALEVTVA